MLEVWFPESSVLFTLPTKLQIAIACMDFGLKPLCDNAIIYLLN